MTTNKILYDLGVAGIGVTLWLTPLDFTRAIGYSLSLIFSGRAYFTGVCLLGEERKNDEKEGMLYDAEHDFYERLLETHIESQLEIKALEIETKTLNRLIPLMGYKRQLESQIHQVAIHPEVTEEDRAQAAKQAIDSAFIEQQIAEEDIRKHFPEALDSTSWKAILKALQDGNGREEIIKDVLGCNQSNEVIGRAYFDYLKRKFLG